MDDREYAEMMNEIAAEDEGVDLLCYEQYLRDDESYLPPMSFHEWRCGNDSAAVYNRPLKPSTYVASVNPDDPFADN